MQVSSYNSSENFRHYIAGKSTYESFFSLPFFSITFLPPSLSSFVPSSKSLRGFLNKIIIFTNEILNDIFTEGHSNKKKKKELIFEVNQADALP